jgi:hypothetical protein
VTEFTQQRIGLADSYGTTASVSVDGDDGDRTIQLRVEIGQCGATGYPTPSAARQLSAALLDAADAAERNDS